MYIFVVSSSNLRVLNTVFFLLRHLEKKLMGFIQVE